MKHLEIITLGLALSITAVAAGSSLPQEQSKAGGEAATNSKLFRSAHPVSPDRGQRVFQQNCGRCHSAPEGFPPSASAAVARHMRVRANLSDADYKALLHFLNP
jgi:cytochrome c5